VNEELDEIEKNQKWKLVPRPTNKNVISTKWVFKTKLNEHDEVITNKEMLVCKGYAKIEGLYLMRPCSCCLIRSNSLVLSFC